MFQNVSYFQFSSLKNTVSLMRLQRPKPDSLASMLIRNTMRNKISIILPFIVSHIPCMYKPIHEEHIFGFLAPILLRFPQEINFIIPSFTIHFDWNTNSSLCFIWLFVISHYENKPIQIYWKFYHQKIKTFQINILIFFIFLFKTDYGYSLELPWRSSSNEYPQSMFLSRTKKKIMYTTANPSFTI